MEEERRAEKEKWRKEEEMLPGAPWRGLRFKLTSILKKVKLGSKTRA